MAPATVSALMLYAWPVASEPIVATTGIRSSFSSRWRIVGFTAPTSADEAEVADRPARR